MPFGLGCKCKKWWLASRFIQCASWTCEDWVRVLRATIWSDVWITSRKGSSGTEHIPEYGSLFNFHQQAPHIVSVLDHKVGVWWRPEKNNQFYFFWKGGLQISHIPVMFRVGMPKYGLALSFMDESCCLWVLVCVLFSVSDCTGTHVGIAATLTSSDLLLVKDRKQPPPPEDFCGILHENCWSSPFSDIFIDVGILNR